jgi:hypothetical protein
MQDQAEKMPADCSQLFLKAGFLIDRGEQIALDAGTVFGNDNLEQAGFSSETLVEGPLGAANALDDVVDAHLLVAVLKKQWRNECDDFAPALIGQPSAAARPRSFCDVPHGTSLNAFVSA